jgi:hypothetical protein
MKNVFLILISLLVFSSCETVVDLTLSEGQKSLVSEAVLEFPDDSDYGNVRVFLTQTASFFSDAPNLPISGANIVLNDTYLLDEHPDSMGYYTIGSIPKEIGAIYKLDIEAEISGVTGSWSGSDYLTQRAIVDSFYVVFKPGQGPFDKGGYHIHMAFDEPGDQVNFYHQKIEVSRNDTMPTYKQPDFVQIYDDELVNGQYLDFEINHRPYLLSDTVSVVFSSITEPTYLFYENINQLLFETIGVGAAPPFPLRGNLISQNDNFENSLGNFQVKNIFEKVIIIEE